MPSYSKIFFAALLACAALLTIPARAEQSETAGALFAHARAEAQREHKHVLAVFSASWCGPCKLYERFLEAPQMKPITDKAFVVVRFDAGEHPGDRNHADTPGGAKLRSALGAAKEPGFPFIIMTGENGKPIVNSYLNGNTSDNIGYPVLQREIDWYIAMLRRAAPALTATDLDATRAWLQKHAPR